jgi:hypothetical protein
MIASKVPGFPSSGWNALGIGLFVGCMVCAIPPGWRALFLPSAAFTLFGLVLEPLGLMVAITAALPGSLATTTPPVGPAAGADFCACA